MVEQSFHLRVGMAGVGENEIRTPREWFSQPSKVFLWLKAILGQDVGSHWKQELGQDLQ